MSMFHLFPTIEVFPSQIALFDSRENLLDSQLSRSSIGMAETTKTDHVFQRLQKGGSEGLAKKQV